LKALDIERAVNNDLPERRKRGEACGSDVAADRLIDDVGSVSVGDTPQIIDPAGLGIVDCGIGAERAGEFELVLRARAAISFRAPARLASWTRMEPTPPAAALMRTVLPFGDACRVR
jgi:hypothetical protein